MSTDIRIILDLGNGERIECASELEATFWGYVWAMSTATSGEGIRPILTDFRKTYHALLMERRMRSSAQEIEGATTSTRFPP